MMEMKEPSSDSLDAEAIKLLKSGKHVELIRYVLDRLHPGDDALKFVIFLAGLSSGMSQKLHVNAVGKSQMGKSHATKVMSHIFPKDVLECVTSSSAKALLYEAKEKGEGHFKGKILVFDEFLDSPEVRALVKVLTDTDAKEAVHKTVIDQKFAELRIKSPPVVLTTSVEPPTDVQINNRFIIGNVNESKEQDERVKEFQAQEAKYGKFEEREPEKLELVRRTLGKILEEKDVDVLVPFADMITLRVRAPRVNFPKLLRLIKAQCYLNRFQRQRLGKDGPYVAIEADAAEAIRLWQELEIYQQIQMDETALDVLREIPTEWCSTKDIVEACSGLRLSGNTIRRKLFQLHEGGLIDREKGEKNNVDLWQREAVFDLSTVSQTTLKNWSDESHRRESYEGWFRKAVSQVSQGKSDSEAERWADYIIHGTRPSLTVKNPKK